MLKALAGVFGGGTFKSIENIASEWIQTDMEKSEAQALMVKTLDPNGLMRRNISDRVGALYAIYVCTTLFMLLLEFGFGLYGIDSGKMIQVAATTEKIKDLFIPITSLFGMIVGASFGVNAMNVKGGK